MRENQKADKLRRQKAASFPEKHASPKIKDKATNSRQKAQNIDTEEPNWKELNDLLYADDSSTRFITTAKLGDIREGKALSLAIQQLTDEQAAVRQQAANAIESLTGIKIDQATIMNEEGAQAERKRLQEWWDNNKDKSLNEIRLEALKKLSEK